MLLFLTFVKINSGIARDAFTQKFALTGVPLFSIVCLFISCLYFRRSKGNTGFVLLLAFLC